MRLKEVTAAKERGSVLPQELPRQPMMCDQESAPPSSRHPAKRILGRLIGPAILGLWQPAIKKNLRCAVDFRYDLLCLGERFSVDASRSALLGILKKENPPRVMIAGCHTGKNDDVEFWLKQGARSVEGVDLYSFKASWDVVGPALSSRFKADVHFKQASLEALPFENDRFDVVVSFATLEHVRNLGAATKEMARVLRPGGLAWHIFGPLYYSFSGDHCISSYGAQHGYDHLLMDEKDYQKKINDQNFYDTQIDPHCAFWARKDQFSFYKVSDYLDLFERYFDREHLLIKISEEGIAYRKAYPDRWKALTDGGVSELDLLVSGLAVIMRKK